MKMNKKDQETGMLVSPNTPNLRQRVLEYYAELYRNEDELREDFYDISIFPHDLREELAIDCTLVDRFVAPKLSEKRFDSISSALERSRTQDFVFFRFEDLKKIGIKEVYLLNFSNPNLAGKYHSRYLINNALGKYEIDLSGQFQSFLNLTGEDSPANIYVEEPITMRPDIDYVIERMKKSEAFIVVVPNNTEIGGEEFQKQEEATNYLYQKGLTTSQLRSPVFLFEGVKMIYNSIQSSGEGIGGTSPLNHSPFIESGGNKVVGYTRNTLRLF